MAEEHWILCGGAGEGKTAGGLVHSIELGKETGKITLDVDALTNKMVEAMPAVMHDLLEIATYVYVGDQLISRGGEQSFDYGDKWHRVLNYRIPVCEYGVWSSETIRELLSQVLASAAGETYRFEFVSREARDRPNFLNVHDAIEHKYKIEEVVLFSGGLDSFTGAMDEAVGHKKNICMVSHQSNNKVVSLQRELHKFITTLCGRGREPLHVPIMINKPKKWTHDKSQRTRSFLFAVLGAIVARYENLNRVRFYENGITSCNLPWDGQTLQARATRSTHPRVLYELSALMTALVGKDFVFENPYFNKTKTEVVKRLVKLKHQAEIERTRSCAGSIYQKPHTHCGKCSQCIERRFSTIAAECEKYDPQYIYFTNIFTDDLKETADRAMAAGFAGFANRVEGMTKEGFASAYMQEALEIARYMGCGDRQQYVEEIFDLHRRHARQVNGVTDGKLKANAGEMRRGVLPDTCLIQLVASRKHLNVGRIARGGRKKAATPGKRETGRWGFKEWKDCGDACFIIAGSRVKFRFEDRTADLKLKSGSKASKLLLLLQASALTQEEVKAEICSAKTKPADAIKNVNRTLNNKIRGLGFQIPAQVSFVVLEPRTKQYNSGIPINPQ
jgi:7-cyano-7-deazaguanine synthase in queuosine biosynthesis